MSLRNRRSLQNLLGAERVAAVDEGDPAGVVGEVERLLHGGVAAADHRDLLAAEEEAIAGGTGRNAEAHEALLAFEAQPLRLCAGADDDGVADIEIAGIAGADEGAFAEVRGDHHVVDQPRAHSLRLARHLLHQPRPLDDVGEAWIVLDVGGDGELAAGLQALHHDRLQIGARRVDRCGIAGGAGADDQDLAAVRRRHARLPNRPARGPAARITNIGAATAPVQEAAPVADRFSNV